MNKLKFINLSQLPSDKANELKKETSVLDFYF
jgi:hypothetical protein